MLHIPENIQDLLSLFSFRGNTKLRPEGAVVEYTPEMVQEYIRCKQDPIYFIKKYIYIVHPDRGVVKFDLYDYQERMIDAYHNNRKVIFLTARQQGKCLSINTNVRIKQKSTGEIFEITLGDFYAWQKTFEGVDLSMLQQELSRLNGEGMLREMQERIDKEESKD